MGGRRGVGDPQRMHGGRLEREKNVRGDRRGPVIDYVMVKGYWKREVKRMEVEEVEDSEYLPMKILIEMEKGSRDRKGRE